MRDRSMRHARAALTWGDEVCRRLARGTTAREIPPGLAELDADNANGVGKEVVAQMLLVLAFLVVVLLAGLGFALHLLWWVAIAAFVLWIVGYAIGRGESAGRHHFYRW
jgi:hypothetical protein